MEFQEIFLQTAAAAFDKQLLLSEVIRDRNWQFSMDSGMISFGTDIRFQAQLLGTESDADQTWLWAWANLESNIPPQLLKAAEQMKAYGEQNQIKPFTEASFALQPNLNGHDLSMAASIICKANAYYRGPYEGGALFLLIQDDNHYPRMKLDPAMRVSMVFPQLIMNMEISDHRTAFAYYLRYYQAEVTTHDREVTGNFSGKTVTAQFDSLGRLENLQMKP